MLRRFPCQTCKTSTSWCRRFPRHRERFRDFDSVRSAVYSPSLRRLRHTRRLPSREIRRRIPTRVRLYSDVCFFSKNASTWRNPPAFWGILNQPTLLRYVPLRAWRKCQKSYRRGGLRRTSPRHHGRLAAYGARAAAESSAAGCSLPYPCNLFIYFLRRSRRLDVLRH